MSRFIAVFSSDLSLTLPVVQSLSSRVVLCPPDGVSIEVSARVERDILKQLIERSDRSVVLKTGVASTRTAAFLAARFCSGSIVPAGKEREFSATFPIQPLFPYAGAHPDLFRVLDHWGIRTIGQLANLPERELSIRLGEAGLHLRRMARGEDTEPFYPGIAELEFEERESLDWAVDSLESLAFILNTLLRRLCARLQTHGKATDSIGLILKLDDRSSYERRLQLAYPMKDPKTLLSILRLKLQSDPPRAAILEVLLQAEPTRARTPQHHLFQPKTASNPELLPRTLARLQALVGDGNVGSPTLLDSHRPDAVRIRPFQLVDSTKQKREKRKSDPIDSPERELSTFLPIKPGVECAPLSLRRIRPPVPALIRPNQILVRAGPWRSSGDWWTGTSEAEGWSHDQWDIEFTDGAVCRVFWDHDRSGWFVDGVYD